MGPRVFTRGKEALQYEVGEIEATLQWGREFSLAERGAATSRRPAGRERFNGAASFHSRKEAPANNKPPVVLALQWGREFSLAES